MLNRVTCIAAILTCAFVPSVYAADIVASDNTPLTTAPSFSWAGFYAGGQVGESWSKGFYEAQSEPREINLPPNMVTYRKKNFSMRGHSFNTGKPIGGAYAGYNWQIKPNLLLGIEGDFAWLSREGEYHYQMNDLDIDEPRSFKYYHTNVKQSWAGAVRARVGIPMGRLLPYVAAGISFTELKYSMVNELYYSQSSNYYDSYRENRALQGGTVGAGIDYAINDHIVLRTEYRYTDYGSESFSLDDYKRELKLKTHDIRLGVAYKF